QQRRLSLRQHPCIQVPRKGSTGYQTRDVASTMGDVEQGWRQRWRAQCCGGERGSVALAGQVVIKEDVDGSHPSFKGGPDRAPFKTRHRKKLLCCGIFWFMFCLAIVGMVSRVALSNDGSECAPVSGFDDATWALWDQPGDRPTVGFNDCTIATNSSMPLSMLRTRGAHNAYKLLPSPEFFLYGLNTLVPPWRYFHDPLRQQLDQGRRNMEIDLHFGVDRANIMVYHIPALDDETTCYCLADCLQTVLDWSNDNPTHLPITVFFEIKYGTLFDDFRLYREFASSDDMLNIDRTIMAMFPRSKVFTPNDLRLPTNASLPDAVESRGWPTVDSMRGKIVFMLMDKDDQIFKEAYAPSEGPNARLEERVMFVMDSGTATDSPEPDLFTEHIAVLKVDSVSTSQDVALVSDFVRRGYLVRSRASSSDDLAKAIEESQLIVPAGSQIMSTDSSLHTELFQGLFQTTFNGACSLAPDTCPTTLSLIMTLWSVQVASLVWCFQNETTQRSLTLTVFHIVSNEEACAEQFAKVARLWRTIAACAMGNAAFLILGIHGGENDPSGFNDALVDGSKFMMHSLATRVAWAPACVLASLIWLLPLLPVFAGLRVLSMQHQRVLTSLVAVVEDHDPVRDMEAWRKALAQVADLHNEGTSMVRGLNKRIGTFLLVFIASSMTLVTVLLYQVIFATLVGFVRVATAMWFVSVVGLSGLITVPAAHASSLASQAEELLPRALPNSITSPGEARQMVLTLQNRLAHGTKIRLAYSMDITWDLVFRFVSLVSSAFFLLYNLQRTS
ncbi:Acid phosphatase, partial [Durusdinium trenchii]